MFLLAHAGFRLLRAKLWELIPASVFTFAHACVCDFTSQNYQVCVDQICPEILGKRV